MPDPTFLWHLIHPLSGDGYQFWSGIGSDFGEATIVISILLIVRHHNCHVKGCPRLGHADEHGDGVQALGKRLGHGSVLTLGLMKLAAS